MRSVLARLVTNGSVSRDPALDAIRGVAILLVLAFHFLDERSGVATTEGFMRVVGHVSSIGWTGVQLFFVLSGFLIGGILIDHRSQQRYFRTFYLRRFVRIIPLYAVSLLLFGLFYAFYDWRSAGLSGLFKMEVPIWSVLSLTQNFFVAAKGDWAGPGWLAISWSLCVEEQFYLLLPCLIYVVPHRRLPQVCIATIVAAPFFRALLLGIWPKNVVAPFVLLPGRMDALFLGVLGAWLWRNEHARKLMFQWRAVISVGFWLVTALLIANLHRIAGGGYKTQTIGLTMIAAYFSTAILLALTASKVPAWLAVLRMPLCLAGLGAYSIYLFHRPIQSLVHAGLQDSPVLSLIVSLFLVVMVSWGCWRFIEAPAIRFGRRAFLYSDVPSEIPETSTIILSVSAS